MKQKNRIIISTFFLFVSLKTIAQGYNRNIVNNKVCDIKLGFKCILIGGLIWAFGMLLIFGLKKNERGIIKEGQLLSPIVAVLCVGGGVVAIFGLILLGF